MNHKGRTDDAGEAGEHTRLVELERRSEEEALELDLVVLGREETVFCDRASVVVYEINAMRGWQRTSSASFHAKEEKIEKKKLTRCVDSREGELGPRGSTEEHLQGQKKKKGWGGGDVSESRLCASRERKGGRT
jgi:hypothetical protein